VAVDFFRNSGLNKLKPHFENELLLSCGRMNKSSPWKEIPTKRVKNTTSPYITNSMEESPS
jgi:hypothetical protein